MPYVPADHLARCQSGGYADGRRQACGQPEPTDKRGPRCVAAAAAAKREQHRARRGVKENVDVHGDLYENMWRRAAADRAARVRVGCYKLSSYRNTHHTTRHRSHDRCRTPTRGPRTRHDRTISTHIARPQISHAPTNSNAVAHGQRVTRCRTVLPPQTTTPTSKNHPRVNQPSSPTSRRASTGHPASPQTPCSHWR